jgi:hypothetical protein
VERIGNRPRNSGMRPYVCKSEAARPFSGVGSGGALVPVRLSSGSLGNGAPKPID